MDPDPPIHPSHGQGPSSPPPLYGSQATAQTKAAGKARLRFAEEQRASWPRSWHTKSEKGDKKGEKKEKGAAAAPGVYWSDDAEANESQYTFYREGTPTPPEYDEEGRERALVYGRSTGATGFDRGGSQRPAPSYDPPPLHPFGSRVCGIRKGLFWTLIFIAGIIIVAVGIGTGVGVGLAKNSTYSSVSANSTAPNSTTSSVPSASPTATPTVSLVSSVSSVSSAPTSEATTSVLCQTTNNTIYHVPGSTKTFRRFCAIDFKGVGGATDITSVQTSSMEDCMLSCSGLANCQGCGWGVLPGDSGPKHRCWLKTDLQTPHNESLDWSFAILQ